MRINELLIEASIIPYKVTNYEIGDVDKLLNMYCSEAIVTLGKSPIWRGMKSKTEDVMMLDPTKGERKSQNTRNYYTLLMDNSPYMKGWPKRSHSFVCTTRLHTAGVYGNAYAMFPVNGTNIAVCPSVDLWDTRVDLEDVGFYNDASWDLINYMMANTFKFNNDRSINDIIAYTETPEFAWILDRQQRRVPEEQRVTPDQFIPWLWKKMAPEKVGFELIPVSQFNPRDHAHNEVWFSAPCVALSEDTYREWINSQ